MWEYGDLVANASDRHFERTLVNIPAVEPRRPGNCANTYRRSRAVSRELLDVPSVHPTGGSYAHAARVGNMLYVAGQVAKDRDNQFVGIGDVEAQTRQVIADLAAILETAGGSLASIVKYTTYLTDEAYLDGYRRARNECMPKPMPPSTLAIVSGLASPHSLVEIEAIAVLDE
jgi:2-iminobutanoate/2-iminopropanoate deaminase